MMVSLIDTHCHLYDDPLAADVPAVLARAAGQGVTRVIVPAYDLATWPKIADLTAVHENIFPAYGLHPWVADQTGPADTPIAFKSHLAAHLAATKAVAIGEIGLDTKVDTTDLVTQIPILTAQLELAVDLDLPVILHCRGAFPELLEAVNRHKGQLRGVLHAFSRGPELAGDFIKAGLLLGLGGAITRDRAKRVRRTAATIPLEHIVLETDAPSIGLEGVLPEQTEPCHVRNIAEALAAIRADRGETLETIAQATTANACRLFRLDP